MNKQELEKLEQAILSLDPSDDSVWTKEGKPMLDSLTEAVGMKVTRELAEKAAADYSRDEAYDEHGVEKPKEGDVNGPEVITDGLEDEIISEESKAESAERCKAAEEALNEASTALDKAKEVFIAAQKEFECATTAERKNHKEVSLADANKAYFKARDEATQRAPIDKGFGGLAEVQQKRPAHPSVDDANKEE